MPDLPLPYTLYRSRRRTVSLEITPALTVLVRAPLRMPQAQIDRFVAAHEDWIAKATARRQASAQAEDAMQAAKADLQARAAAVLPARVAHYAAQMGLSPQGVRITDARTRFGSCSAQNRLCFSWRLMAYPPAAVDYVVVHELAHIREKNHSAAFYAVVEAVLPDYRERVRLLRTPPTDK